MPTVQDFLPSRWGFHFTNFFPRQPLFYVSLGLGQLPIGNAVNGMCGGMIFAARDYFEAGLTPPPDTTAPTQGLLYSYLVQRLFDSFDLPWGPIRYLYLMNPAVPDDEARFGFGPHGRAWVMIREEWPKIKADLERGLLCSLGLIRLKSHDWRSIGKNHQVLAYGYELNGDDLAIHVYDPNHPDNDDLTLSLNLGDPWHATPVSYSASETVYCFFRTNYTFSPPPIL